MYKRQVVGCPTKAVVSCKRWSKSEDLKSFKHCLVEVLLRDNKKYQVIFKSLHGIALNFSHRLWYKYTFWNTDMYDLRFGRQLV